MKTIFLDRDGTIIVDKDYLSDPALVELEKGAGPGLRMLQNDGYQLVVVTNQSGVGRRLFPYSSVVACNERVDELLNDFDVKIALWLVCPHSPEERCNCRKPMTGLIDQAKLHLDVDAVGSYVIGDKDSDLMLAKNTGLKGILVSTGSGKTHAGWAASLRFPVVQGLEAAARLITGRN